MQRPAMSRKASTTFAASLGILLTAHLTGCLPSGRPSATSPQHSVEPAMPSIAPSQAAIQDTLPGRTHPHANGFPIPGTWTGTAKSETHQMYVRIVLQAPCQVGDICGTFVLSYPCAGAFVFVGQEDDIYEFRSADKSGLCSGDGRDFVQLLPDGTLGYDSRGAYGRAIGILSPLRLQTSAIPPRGG